VGLSGSTTTLRRPLGETRADPEHRQFLFELMQETVSVGRAHGVALPEDYAAQRLVFADTLPADMTSSMHHDLDRGNRLEVEWLSGGVVQLGEQKGIPTPRNRDVWEKLAPLAGGRGA
jgi:2-dehydropantoate 2-reductase